MVIFKPNTPKSVIEESCAAVEAAGGKVTQRYDTVLLGYAAQIPDGYLTTLQQRDQEFLDFVEQDQVVSINPPVQFNSTDSNHTSSRHN